MNRLVQTVLSQNGWTPEYRVDIASYIARLQEIGYTPHPVWVDFMTRFGGMEYHYSVFNAKNFLNTQLDSFCSYGDDVLFGYKEYGLSEEDFLESTLPCGFTDVRFHSDYLALYAHSSGRFYVYCLDTYLWDFNNYEAALEHIFTTPV